MFRSGIIVTSLLLAGCTMPQVAEPGPGSIGTAPPRKNPGPPMVQVACCSCIGHPARLVSINTGSGPGTVPYRVTGPNVPLYSVAVPTPIVHPSWNASLPPAGWIHPSGSLIVVTGGVFIYSIQIRVPNCSIPMAIRLDGMAAGDDLVKVRVDGNQIGETPMIADPTAPSPAPAGVPGYGYRAARMFGFGQALSPGTHLLEFEVPNIGGGPSALLVRAQLTGTCPQTLEVPETETRGPARN
ncbi:MAG: hypothetical protein V4574_19365 [Pseudomonadota bacterium]